MSEDEIPVSREEFDKTIEAINVRLLLLESFLKVMSDAFPLSPQSKEIWTSFYDSMDDMLNETSLSDADKKVFKNTFELLKKPLGIE